MQHTTDQPTVFLLVRHAQTLWNQEQRHTGSSEVGLSKEASNQITILTEELLASPIQAIYSSPLSRCILTIEKVAKTLKIKPVICDELKERHLGLWEGKSPRELLPSHPGYHFPESAYNGDFRIPGSEPLEYLENRLRNFLHAASKAYPASTVAVSTHSGVIWTIQHRIVNNPLATLIWPGNCSITTVEVDKNGRISLVSVKNIV